MRLLKIWIFASIYLTIFKIYYANGIKIIDQLPNNWVTTNSFEPPIDYPESCPKNTNMKQAKPRKYPPYDGSENRMLRRSRKGKKIRRKKAKKNKKRKSALINNNASKNYAKSNIRPYKLRSDYLLDSELSTLEDDDLSNSILESDLLDDTLDLAPTDDLASVDPLDTSFDMADPYNDIESLDDLSTGSSLDTDDLTESTKKYWDEDLVEPEYVISEWFAILDGKKFDKSSGNKFPYVSDGESDYSDTYLSDKTENSGHLFNSYSSGSMYTPYDSDNEDYVQRINVDPEDLYMIHRDTGEDVVENRILEKRHRTRSRTGRNSMGYGRLKRGKRRNRGKGRSGIYDVQKAFETDVPVEPGTYRRFDEDEIERYGLMKNTPDIAPSEDMAGLYTGEADFGPMDSGIMDMGDSGTQSGYDVGDIELGDSPYLRDPVDNFDGSSEYLPFDQIISNDYDDFGPPDDPNNPYSNGRRGRRRDDRQCKKDLKRLRRKYNNIIGRLKEQASE